MRKSSHVCSITTHRIKSVIWISLKLYSNTLSEVSSEFAKFMIYIKRGTNICIFCSRLAHIFSTLFDPNIHISQDHCISFSKIFILWGVPMAWMNCDLGTITSFMNVHLNQRLCRLAEFVEEMQILQRNYNTLQWYHREPHDTLFSFCQYPLMLNPSQWLNPLTL